MCDKPESLLWNVFSQISYEVWMKYWQDNIWVNLWSWTVDWSIHLNCLNFPIVLFALLLDRSVRVNKQAADFSPNKIIYWAFKVIIIAELVCSKFNIERIFFPFPPASTYPDPDRLFWSSVALVLDYISFRASKNF